MPTTAQIHQKINDYIYENLSGEVRASNTNEILHDIVTYMEDNIKEYYFDFDDINGILSLLPGSSQVDIKSYILSVIPSPVSDGSSILGDGSDVSPFSLGYDGVVISGGSITWIDEYNITLSNTSFRVHGTTASSPTTSLTIDQADPVYDRIDLLVVSDGLAKIVKGTASRNPVEPNYNKTTELLIKRIFIPAGKYPTLDETIYSEGVEWSIAGNYLTDKLKPNGTGISGTYAVEATAANSGAFISFSRTITSLSQFNILKFKIKSKETWGANCNIKFEFYNGVTNVGSPVYLGSGNYGFFSSNTTSVFDIQIPVHYFNLQDNQITTLRVTVLGSTTIGFFLDDVKLSDARYTGTIDALWLPMNNHIYNVNSGNVGIGSFSSGIVPGQKLHVEGEIFSKGVRVDANGAAGKTGIYSPSANILDLWAGNGKVLQISRGGINTSAISSPVSLVEQSGNTGFRAFWEISANVQSAITSNTVDFIQLYSRPNINQFTFGSGKIRFIYYNPTVAALNGSPHIAWENTSGDIIFGNLSGVGDRNVLVDSTGKLKIGTPSVVAGSDTHVQFNDSGSMGGDSAFIYDKVTKTLRIYQPSGVVDKILDIGGLADGMYFASGLNITTESGWYSALGDQAVAVCDTTGVYAYANRALFYDEGAKIFGFYDDVYAADKISFRMGGITDGFVFNTTINSVNDTSVLRFKKSDEIIEIGDVSSARNGARVFVDMLNDSVNMTAKNTNILGGLTYKGKEVWTNHLLNYQISGSVTMAYVDTGTVMANDILLPTQPEDGQLLSIGFGGTISSGLVWSGNLLPSFGHNIIGGAPGNKNAGDNIMLVFRADTNTWYYKT